MIKINILESIDLDLIGEHTFFKESITLGNTAGDILIDDDFSTNLYLSIKLSETEDQKAIIRFAEKFGPYYINNQKKQGPTQISKGDKIKLQNIFFEVIELQREATPSVHNLIEKGKPAFSKNKKAQDILEIIDNELEMGKL